MMETKTNSLFLTAFFVNAFLVPSASARTTFLPDWHDENHFFAHGEADNLCARSIDPIYQHISIYPQCGYPKIFDKRCPHDADWISECYCPSKYSKACASPLRGVGVSCDEKYEDCCDTRCPSGYSSYHCSYPYVENARSSTGCGETCYACRLGNDCVTACAPGETISYLDRINDFNGKACVSCSPPLPPPDPCAGITCPKSMACGSQGCKTYSTATSCCPSVCTACQPACIDTCSSKGYQSGVPNGQTCSSVSVCGSTCYYNCKPITVEKTCSVSGYYNGSSCSSFNGVNCAQKYAELGKACYESGKIPGTNAGSCDVDSWRGCCESCTGGI